MTDPATTRLRCALATQSRTRPARRRQLHRLRRLADAGALLERPRRAPRRAHRGRPLRPLAHGRDRRHGPEAARLPRLRARRQAVRDRVGQAKYSLLLAEAGGIIDDLVVYRTGDDRFLVVANAATARRRRRRSRAPRRRLRRRPSTDESDDVALIAVQGPDARAILEATAPASPTSARPLADAAVLPRRPMRRVLRGRPAAHRPHRLHRRGRLRAVHRAPTAPPASGRRSRAGGAARSRSRRPRQPRHPAPRGGHAAVRPRAGARHLPAQAGLGRVVALAKEGDFVGRAAHRGGPGADGAACSSASRPRAGAPAAPATPCFEPATTAGRRDHERRAVADARAPDRDGLSSRRAAARRHRTLRRRAGHPHPRAPSTALPFYKREGRTTMTDSTALKYTAEHEWVAVDGDIATVGITAYAAEKLGDVVFVDLPAVGCDRRPAARRRRDRVDQVGRRAFAPRQRHGRRDQRRRRRRPRARQQRPVRRGLADQGPLHRAARARRDCSTRRYVALTGRRRMTCRRSHCQHFTDRHIGTDAAAQRTMLATLGYDSRRGARRRRRSRHRSTSTARETLDIPPAATEREALAELRALARRTRVRAR